MNKELEKESLGTNTLKPPKNKATESAATQEVSNNSNSSSKEDTIVLPPLPSLEPKPDFNAVYDILHGKFPEIININKPVLLAVGIRKEMSKETGVSSVVLKRWIAWYCRKSNYYANHILGAIRFHLEGSEAGIVTQSHQEKMEKRLEKTKVHKTTPSLENKNKNSDNSLSDVRTSDVK
jgi:ProQ/FINO family